MFDVKKDLVNNDFRVEIVEKISKKGFKYRAVQVYCKDIPIGMAFLDFRTLQLLEALGYIKCDYEN